MRKLGKFCFFRSTSTSGIDFDLQEITKRRKYFILLSFLPGFGIIVHLHDTANANDWQEWVGVLDSTYHSLLFIKHLASSTRLDFWRCDEPWTMEIRHPAKPFSLNYFFIGQVCHENKLYLLSGSPHAIDLSDEILSSLGTNVDGITTPKSNWSRNRVLLKINVIWICSWQRLWILPNNIWRNFDFN